MSQTIKLKSLFNLEYNLTGVRYWDITLSDNMGGLGLNSSFFIIIPRSSLHLHERSCSLHVSELLHGQYRWYLRNSCSMQALIFTI